MRQLSYYVGKTVFASILIVLLVVLAIDVIASVVDGLGEIRNQYRFNNVLVNTLLTLPARIYSNIPFATLIGSLVGLGILAGNSELVVMRAAGVSLLRITGFVARPVLLVILLGGVLGEYLVPVTDQWAQSLKLMLRGDQESVSAHNGVWNREGQEYMHFNAVYPNGKLIGVTRYRFDDEQNLQEASFSARATYLGSHWLEEEGQVTQFFDDHTETEHFITRRWDTELSPDLLTLVLMPPESLAISNLRSYGEYLDVQGQKSGAYWLAFWNKALQPLVIMALVLIAVSFIFGPLREATMGYRIFSGVVVGIVFQTSLEMLGPSSMVFGFSPFWAVMSPIVVCVLVGLVLLRRAA